MVGKPEPLVEFFRLECTYAPLSGEALVRLHHRIDDITDRTEWSDVAPYINNSDHVVSWRKRRRLMRGFLETMYGGLDQFSLGAACRELDENLLFFAWNDYSQAGEMNYLCAAMEDVDLEAALRSFVDESPHFHKIKATRVAGHRLTQRGCHIYEEFNRLACISPK